MDHAHAPASSFRLTWYAYVESMVKRLHNRWHGWGGMIGLSQLGGRAAAAQRVGENSYLHPGRWPLGQQTMASITRCRPCHGQCPTPRNGTKHKCLGSDGIVCFNFCINYNISMPANSRAFWRRRTCRGFAISLLCSTSG